MKCYFVSSRWRKQPCWFRWFYSITVHVFLHQFVSSHGSKSKFSGLTCSVTYAEAECLECVGVPDGVLPNVWSLNDLRSGLCGNKQLEYNGDQSNKRAIARKFHARLISHRTLAGRLGAFLTAGTQWNRYLALFLSTKGDVASQITWTRSRACTSPSQGPCCRFHMEDARPLALYWEKRGRGLRSGASVGFNDIHQD